MVKVLVVEDSPMQRQLISDLLQQLRLTVTTAADGEEALAYLDQFCPDLVVSDIVMPRVNGYELCRRLKSDPKTCNVPIVMCSSKTTDVDRYWGMKNGADAYIGKPFEPNELIQTVTQLLQKRGQIV